MSKIRFAIIADDNTGASDAAGMLTQKGVRTCLINDFSATSDTSFIQNFDAVVLGTQSRSVEPGRAYQITKDALGFLGQFSPEMIQIKYCSTFDSTPQGNIGQFLDAAKDFSGQASIVVCPALPVNGRTTYMGYHFVNGQLLSESPLKDHPLNPMTDSYLPRWLSYQTKHKVGKVSLEDIRKGVDSVRQKVSDLEKDETAYWISDAVSQHDIEIVMQVVQKEKIISGGSGITAAIPDLIFKGLTHLNFETQLKTLNKGMLVLSGSMSPVTQKQNINALESGNFTGLKLDPLAIIKNKFDNGLFRQKVGEMINANKNVLVYSPHESKKQVMKFLNEHKINEVEAGLKISNVLAEIAYDMISNYSLGKLLVAGGETSGEICKKLNINEMEVGLPLNPGVPYCFPQGYSNLLLVLKSGNFGSENIYLKTLKL